MRVTILIAALLAVVYLAYSGPEPAVTPGLLPALLLVATLALLNLRVISPDLAAIVPAAVLVLNPWAADAIRNPDSVRFLLGAAGMLLMLLVRRWTAMKYWSLLFLWPLWAAIGWAATGAFLILLVLYVLLFETQYLPAAWSEARGPVFGTLWFVAMYIAAPAQPVAAAIGLVFAMTWLLMRLMRVEPRFLAPGAALGIVLLTGAASVARGGMAVVPEASTKANAGAGDVVGPDLDHAVGVAAHMVALSRVFYLRGEYPQAVEAALAAVKEDPSSADAYNNLGASLAALQLWDEAIAAEKRALELRPDLETARSTMKRALEQKRLAGR